MAAVAAAEQHTEAGRVHTDTWVPVAMLRHLPSLQSTLGDHVDLTLSDDDVEMVPRIGSHQKKDIESICSSTFGQKFMEPHVGGRSLNSVLRMVRTNQFASLDEATTEAIDILDAHIHFFQHDKEEETLEEKMFRNEMICMADHLKDMFADLQDVPTTTTTTSKVTEDALMYKLLEIFPNMDINMLSNKTKSFLDTSDGDNLDLGMAINEISQEILNQEEDSEPPEGEE